MPIISDLDAAMMQPAVSVPAVRRLGGGSIRLNDAGRPLREVGRDAVVYELRTPIGRIVALRCYLRSDPRRDQFLAAHYGRLATDSRLEPLRGGSGPLPKEIRWIDDGLALPGPDLRQATSPIVAMERVPGRTLLRAIDRLCREGETEPIDLLADNWLSTVIALEESGFSHGDLAADNLMARPDGSIALVDLDTAWWPSAPGAAPRAPGALGYAHPGGAASDLALRDRFPILVIWASLRILARHPELRQRWGDRPGHDTATLLWSADDLRRPERAPIFAALDALGDDTLAPLLEVVRRAIRFAPDETPPLAEVAERLERLGFPRTATPLHLVGRRAWRPPPHPRLATDVGPVSDVGDDGWDEEDSRLPPRSEERNRRHPDASRTTTIAERERRHATARQLAAALAARDIETALRLWESSRAIPEVAIYAAAVDQLRSTEATDAIDRALRRRDDDALVATVAAADDAGIAPSLAARKAVRAAGQRLAARAALDDALAADDTAALAALARSGELDCLGRLEPSQARAIKRALAWPVLERALAGDDDAAIAAAFDPEIWREEAALSPAARERLDLARSRLRWLGDVRAALRHRDGATLRGLLATAPTGAEERLTEVESRRILRVTMREAAVSRLERALREGSDRDVVAALTELESAGAPLPDALDWEAVRGVVDRISLADALRAAATADPPDTARLARLLPAARATLGDSVGAGEPDWFALEQAVLQAAHLARLREAIAAGDDRRIASAAEPDPYGARLLLAVDEQQRVQLAIDHMRHRV
jgi:hypothetical protein